MIFYEETLLVPYGAPTPEARRLLVLAPHPDDEVLGAGGLAALTVRLGGAVQPVILTDGGGGNFSGTADSAAYVEVRREESRRAAAILWTEMPRFLDFPDRSLAERRGELDEAIRREIGLFRPDLVLAPSPTEPHPDHRAAARAAWDAFLARPEGDQLAFYEVGAALAPNRLVCIDEVQAVKLAAIRAFTSQLEERPFDELMAGLNRYRAMTLPPPARFAEGFFVLDRTEARRFGWDAVRRALGAERPEPGALEPPA